MFVSLINYAIFINWITADKLLNTKIENYKHEKYFAIFNQIFFS